MATIKFSKADVKRLLGLPNTEAVEDLVLTKALTITAYTRTGRPLFDGDDVVRVAVARAAGPERASSKARGAIVGLEPRLIMRAFPY